MRLENDEVPSPMKKSVCRGSSAAIAAAFTVVIALYTWKKRNNQNKQSKVKSNNAAYTSRIGSTPMVELRSLSKLVGCRILAKVEYSNPGGTGKDRIALAMIEEAERNGSLRENGTIVEGTSGSTGISLSALAAARGYKCIIVMPDDQAPEKRLLMESYGSKVHVVKTAAIANPNHYVNVAQRIASDLPGAVFMNQFETLANFRAHVRSTGPEIWRGAGGRIDAFIMAAGTGGTIAGVSRYLKTRSEGRTLVVLADPPGSSLYHYVKNKVCWNVGQTERNLRMHRYDTIAEGIGLDRVTANLALAEIDDAVAVTDQQAIDTAHHLLRHEGLFVGSSSAVNVAATIDFCSRANLPSDAVVVTVLCDSGHRHTSRFWCREKAVKKFGLNWPCDSAADINSNSK